MKMGEVYRFKDGKFRFYTAIELIVGNSFLKKKTVSGLELILLLRFAPVAQVDRAPDF